MSSSAPIWAGRAEGGADVGAVRVERVQAGADDRDAQLHGQRARRTAARTRASPAPSGRAARRSRRCRPPRTRRAPSPRRRRRPPARRRGTARAAAGTGRASENRWPTSASTRRTGCAAARRRARRPSAPMAATKNMTCSNHTAGYSPSRRSGVRSGGSASSISLVKIRSRARVVGELVVVAHRDRVERAGHLAVAAEDAARHVDLVDRRVALAGRHLVLGRVLGGHHADALGRAGRGAERAADALLEPRVLEAVQLVAAAEARVDRRLLLGVLDRHRALDHAAERGLQAAQRLAEGAVERRRRRRARARAGPR